jgi:hypothetical protein
MEYNSKGNQVFWNGANCYGYAARDNRWLQLSSDYEDIDAILEDNPTWRLVSKESMVLGKEYVAYRYGNRDFHFMYRNEKGMWRHKPGGTRVRSISQKDVFASMWKGGPFNVYTSKVWLFEVMK